VPLAVSNELAIIISFKDTWDFFDWSVGHLSGLSLDEPCTISPLTVAPQRTPKFGGTEWGTAFLIFVSHSNINSFCLSFESDALSLLQVL